MAVVRARKDENGHTSKTYVNKKGRSLPDASLVNLLRRISKLVKLFCRGKPQLYDTKFQLPAGFTEIYGERRDRIRCEGCSTVALLSHRACFVKQHACRVPHGLNQSLTYTCLPNYE
eukprot:5434286-Amphidinium_carterae.1